MPLPTSAPMSDLDLWSDPTLLNPYRHFEMLRDLGPLVWMTKVKAWGAFRYKAAKEVLGLPTVFSSANGVMLNEPMNRATSEAGVLLCSDDPRHGELRRVFARPLTPGAVSKLRERLTLVMNEHIKELLKRRTFDAVSDLAQVLPLTVVSELVGLTEDGRANMLTWAAGTFDAFGPDYSPRTHAGLTQITAALEYVSNVSRDALDPKGWGAALFEAADRGEIEVTDARTLLADYLVPALDTTINALSSAIWLFAHNPDQWDLVRADHSRISAAIDEVIRLESPIRGFGRQAIAAYEMEGVSLQAGDRVHVFYASANRDERHYSEPERFLVMRRAKDHLGFGYGHHHCAGMHLARLEISIALTALAHSVSKFSIKDVSRPIRNTLNGLDRLIVDIEPAPGP